MLSIEDLHTVQDAFGVDEAQVRRDHVISHALAALSTIADERLTFFGGTALARTRLPGEFRSLSPFAELDETGSSETLLRHGTVERHETPRSTLRSGAHPGWPRPATWTR